MSDSDSTNLSLQTGPTFSRRITSIFGGSIGNLIEWYDFYVYNAFAIYFSKAFFPNFDQTAQFLNTFLIYAFGFLIRPVGGWLIGAYADRAGRRGALTISVMLMCGGSLMIALCPTYMEIGIGAPIILLLARLLQGLSLGGEYGASATYLSEIALSRHRGFYTSFQYVTLIGGQVLGSLTLLIMQFFFTPAALDAWYWRVPFFLGAACAVFGIYLRRNLAETEDFHRSRREAGQEGQKTPAWRQLLKHPREVALVFGLTMGGTTAFYTYSTYMPTFLVNTVHLSREQSTQISFVTLLLFAAMQPAFGYLSDLIGRRPVLMVFGIGGTLATVPVLTALSHTRDYTTALLLITAALFIVSAYTSINAVVKAELFPASVRALGVGLPYALAVSIFGGTAPYVGLQFKSWGWEAGFYWYVSVLIAGSAIIYWIMPDTKKISKIDAGV